jgi:hypothetical protein
VAFEPDPMLPFQGMRAIVARIGSCRFATTERTRAGVP